MYKFIMTIVLSLLLQSCYSYDIVPVPSKLPSAYVGEHYRANLYFLGAIIENSFEYELSDPNFKLKPMDLDPQSHHIYNSLVIEGQPSTPEDIKLIISGSGYGTMFPGTDFKKEYTIKVKER